MYILGFAGQPLWRRQ